MYKLGMLMLLTASPLEPLAEGDGAIVVTVTNVRNDVGLVRCSLFASAQGFPGKSPLDRGQQNVRAEKGKVTCSFERVPAGAFAVSVLHDENENGVLDKSFFGAPIEGYGASNNVLPAGAPPTFEASRFNVAAGERVTLSITLKY
jgi:uncharacterized protein (DUF2141 family)